MHFRIRTAATLLPLATAAAVASCGLDKLTASNSDEFPASLEGFAIAGDTVLIVGDSLLFSAQLPAALEGASIGFEWRSDNPTIASVGADGRVRGVNPGTTAINAVIAAPSLAQPVSTSMTLRVRYNSIGMLPIDSIQGLGGAWRLFAFGNNKNGTRHSFIDPTYSLANANDTTFVGFNTTAGGALTATCTPPAGGFCQVVAKRVGTATVRATFDGMTATAPVKVVQVASRIVFQSAAITISGIGSQATNPATILDANDQVMTGALQVWTSLNPAVATVNSAGVITAAGAGSTRIQLAVGNIFSQFDVRVVVPGAAARLNFHSVPANVVAGTPPGFGVSIVDANGNLVPSATNSITISQLAGPAGSLVGTLTATPVNGTATFPTARMRFSGSGNVLRANAAGLSQDQTVPFTVTPAPAFRLSFTTQPVNGAQNTNLSAVRVSVLDSIGNIVTSATNSITVAIGANPGSSTLSGTTTASAVAGTATFSDLRLNNLGSNYTLTASTTGLTGATSGTFAIVGAASRLRFATQPVDAEAGLVLPAFTVQVQDASGSLVGNATNPVTIAFNTSCGVGTVITGTSTVNAVNGVATFSDIRLRTACSVYRFAANATGLTSDVSNAFAVTAGPPALFAISGQPTTPMTAGCCQFITAQIRDSLGNASSTSVTVTVSLGTNPTGAVMTGTTTKSSAAGAVNFNDLSITKAGIGYRLTLSGPGMTPTSSNLFDVQPSSSNKLVFITSPPSTVQSGSTITPPVVVEVRDFFDNPVPGYSGTIDLTRRRQDFGGTSSTLNGIVSATVTNGRATFSSLSMTGVEGNPLVLVANATGGGLNNGISTTFTVVP